MKNIHDLQTLARVIPVIIIQKIADAVPLAEAIYQGGIKEIEITLRTDCALKAIENITQVLPDMVVGAGTVLTTDQMHEAHDRGAKFFVSPGLSSTLCHFAKQHQYPYLPGVVTPSEVMQAMELGFDFVKFFPAELSGGIKMLKTYNQLFPTVSFCPTGGLNPSNYFDYLKLPNVKIIGGSWLTPQDEIDKKNWLHITHLVSATLI